MALFGNIDVLREQVDSEKFKVAFEYLEKVIDAKSIENSRLMDLAIGAFEKVELDSNDFALEQVYNSRERGQCFFESHKQYIDVQFILEGKEIIEVVNSNELQVDFSYNEEMDLIKYNDTTNASQIKLKKGDIAIFFPEDAHMPCVQVDKSVKVVKTVVKVIL